MVATSYTILTKNNDIVATFNSADPNSWTRGETATFEFWFGEGDTLTVSGTYTVESGTAEAYETVTVESGATLTIEANATLQTTELTNNGTVNVDGTLVISGDGELEARVRNYGDHAGSFATITTLDNTQKYSEQLPSDASVDTIVWGIRPNGELTNENIDGIWGIIESFDDQRGPALNTVRYQVELRILAEFNEYSDHSALETDRLI